MEFDPTRCFVCRRPFGQGEANERFSNDSWSCSCAVCGRYECSYDCATNKLLYLSDPDRARLSAVIRERHEGHQYEGASALEPLLTNSVDALLASAPQSHDVSTKARKLLSAIARRSRTPGENVKLHDATDSPLAYAANLAEFRYLTDYVANVEWVAKVRSDVANSMLLQVTPKGWEEVQRRPRVESAQGFVAMWFDAQMAAAYLIGIEPAIESYGYSSRRIDIKEFNEDIVFECMAEIRESRFVVADVTGQNNGAYFEAGFARGLEIPVIWTCRKDDTKNIHFDATHNKQIRWETPTELRQALETRIIATIGRGTFRANRVEA